MQEVRVLSREKQHRLAMGAPGIFAVLQQMARSANRPGVAAEAASAILNLCYEGAHVAAVLEGGGVLLLVACLRRPHADLQANAAGALQSICFLVCIGSSHPPPPPPPLPGAGPPNAPMA